LCQSRLQLTNPTNLIPLITSKQKAQENEMSDNQQKMVWAIFASKDAAGTAVAEMKSWDKASQDIKLGAIGAVYKTKKGNIKTKKYGRRNLGKGAAVGAILGVLGAVLPAVTLAGGLVAGTVAGATVGLFNKKSLGLSHDDLKKISDAIKGDQVLLLVLADDEAEAAGLVEIMTRHGGEHAGSEWVLPEGLDEADAIVA
jgi:uncharacterized membrane protein